MEHRYNPLKLDGSDWLLPPLPLMMAGLRKWDKPTKKKLPVEVGVVGFLCKLGQLTTASTKDAVVGD